MQYYIKRIQEDDLIDIHRFMNVGNSHIGVSDYNIVRWIFVSPIEQNEYCGFIARANDGEVAGIIGYSLNNYIIGRQLFSGIIPKNWMVSPNHRGILGISLLLEVVKLADFTFAIQGTESAQIAYRAVKLKKVSKSYEYTKVNSIQSYLRYHGGFNVKNIIKSLIYYSRKTNNIKGTKIELREYNDTEPEDTRYSETFRIIPTIKRNQWINSCPFVETFMYSVFLKQAHLGSVICYIKEKHNNQRSGRIVYIPFAEKRVFYYQAILSKVEKILVEKGCCAVSIMVLDPTLREACIRQGFKSIKGVDANNIYVRDLEQRLGDVDFRNWFLTYYESDKGYVTFV